MPYTPTTWVNGSAPALSATNLNNIETGISNSINKDGSVAMTAQFVTVAGSATTPSIAPTGDTDTGIFFPFANTMAFVEGGTEVMRINSSGQVSIGTTTPGGTFAVNNATDSRIRLLISDVGIMQMQATSTEARLHAIGTTTPLTFWTNGTEKMRINGLGQTTFVTAGNQATPSISLSTDTNTGIYWASADKLAITEGGKGLTFDEFKMSLSMGAMI